MTATSISSSYNRLQGPSGRSMAAPMEQGLVDLLSQHLTMEREASANYFSIAIWSAQYELRGFSKFFSNESRSEQEHAARFAEYLIARGQKVPLQELPSPKQDFNSIEEALKFSFQIESDVTTSLQQIYSMAERSSDLRTTVFLDPIIEGQITSEDEFAYLLGKVRFANNQPSAIIIIDNDLNNGILPKTNVA